MTTLVNLIVREVGPAAGVWTVNADFMAVTLKLNFNTNDTVDTIPFKHL